MPFLGVNIDHVATLRQARGGSAPDPVRAALEAQRAGADSIVAHLREDRRHIQDDDIRRLRNKLTIKLNVEMSIEPSVVKTVLRHGPDAVTLVPEKRRERTTESGLDVVRYRSPLGRVIDKMHQKNIGVSLFLDPIKKQMNQAARLGVQAVEIHTGDYANAKSSRAKKERLSAIRDAVEYSNSLGLTTHVGHGLDYANVSQITNIAGIEEYNIGYAIICRAVYVGLAQAVTEMRYLIQGVPVDHEILY
jgi:pyridoxine 5-phosphate synthase